MDLIVGLVSFLGHEFPVHLDYTAPDHIRNTVFEVIAKLSIVRKGTLRTHSA